MKGFKAFKKGLVCRGKQYAENTVFEEENAVICNSGMHFCKNPLDCLDYYPLIDANGEFSDFAEVEALDKVFTDDNEKYCTKKLKIGAKLDLAGFIKASVDVTRELIKEEARSRTKDAADLVKAGGYYSTLRAAITQSLRAAITQSLRAAITQRLRAAITQRLRAAITQRLRAAITQRLRAAGIPQ